MSSPAATPPPSATQTKEETKEVTKPTDETKKVDPPKDTKKEEPVKETKKEEPKKEEPKEEEPPKKATPKSEEATKKEEKAPDTTAEEKKETVKSPEPQANGEASTEAPDTPKGPTLREQFRAFSKFGDIKSDGKQLTLSQSDKWMKQAKVIDGKTITTTDTAITFRKFKQIKIAYPDYEKYLQELAKYKNQDPTGIKDKMKGCGTPGTRGTTSVAKGGAFDRLTDTKTYTGSHKQRFDAEGKGKGVAGRKDVDDKSGYVSGYKNKNTYSKTH